MKAKKVGKQTIYIGERFWGEDFTHLTEYIEAVGFLLNLLEEKHYERFGLSDVNTYTKNAGRLLGFLTDAQFDCMSKWAQDWVEKERAKNR